MAAPIRALQALQADPQPTGLSAAVLALAGSVERLAAAIGGQPTATGAAPAATERHQPS